MINYLLILLLSLIVPFSELLRFSLGPYGFIRVVDGLFLLFILFNSKLLIEHKKKLSYIYVFLGTLILSNLFNIQQINLTGIFYLIRTVLYLLGLVIILTLPKSSPFRRKAKFVYFSLNLLLITGLIQYFLYPDLRNLYYLGFDPHLSRLFGLFLDPNLIGLVFAWSALYYLYYIKTDYKFFALFFIIALLLTYSRISWLAFIIGLAYLFVTKNRLNKLLLIPLIGLFILIGLLLPNRFGEGTNLFRINSLIAKQNSYALAKPYLKNNFWFGIGFNNLKLIKTKTSNIAFQDNSTFGLDNSWLTILVTSGLFGLATYLWFFYKLYFWQNNEFKVFTLTYFIHSLSTNSFFTPGVLIFFFLFINLTQATQYK